MARKYWRGRPLEFDDDPAGDPLGPDERDRDLLEDRLESIKWDQPRPPMSPLVRYGILALSLLAVLSILVPLVAAATR